VEDEEGTTQQVIWWQGAGSALPEGRFDLAYVVRSSDYRGQRAVQVEWVDARPVEAPVAALRSEPATVQVVDYRGVPDPRRRLERLRLPGGALAQEDVRVWAEAGARAQVAGQDRYELGPSRGLVIWTTPPGPRELQAVLEKVSPEQVIIFGIDPGLDSPGRFLKRLTGLAKRALDSQEGWAGISTLAAATAQRESTVRAGLAWLVARGHVAVPSEDGGAVRLAAGSQMASGDLHRAVARLRELLEETAAYRAYFAQVDKERLISALGDSGGRPSRRF